jgi:hypothetical protein
LRRSKRARTGRNLGKNFIAYIIDNDPICYSKSINFFNAFWLETINIELDSIISNHALELVELHTKTKSFGCKKVFKKKLESNDTIDKYMVYLVAKSYKENVDYLILIFWLLKLHQLECYLPLLIFINLWMSKLFF